ncbi:hypothetical protein ACIRSU_32635 [Streptomyces sp. NPDC101160]|uniref:hypothetical protein n=1 Tax=Streptomyces sp. NPDC101160 TaxID=3366118 RepID=UPI003828B7E7
MSEETNPNAAADAGLDEGAAMDVPAPAPAPVRAQRRPRRLFPYVLGGVLVLGLAAGGTYTGVTVAGAERHAPTIGWEEPAPDAASDAESKDPAADALVHGKSSTPLSKLLLPVPEGYVLGPDVDRYGNDGELSARDAIALVEQQGKGLSGKKRRDFDKRIEKLGIQGIAVRSYASEDDDLVVEVQVVHLKDKRFGADLRRLQAEIADLLGFPKGPKIADHKNASCFAMPKPKKTKGDEGLDGMVCSANESGYYVSVNASGSRPFDKSAVAELVKKQLDHIKSPGEYV